MSIDSLSKVGMRRITGICSEIVPSSKSRPAYGCLQQGTSKKARDRNDACGGPLFLFWHGVSDELCMWRKYKFPVYFCSTSELCAVLYIIVFRYTLAKKLPGLDSQVYLLPVACRFLPGPPLSIIFSLILINLLKESLLSFDFAHTVV